MLDVLKFKLASSKMMKGIIAKFMEKKIYEKVGYKINIRLNDVQINMIDGEIKSHLDVDLNMNKSEFTRLMESFDED